MKRMPKPPSNQAQEAQSQAAFTILELAMITLLLLLLTGIVFGGLSNSRSTSVAFQCQNNLRQLGYAWQMYADDNDGRLVLNRDGVNAGQAPGAESWTAGWLDFSTTNPDNTNVAMLVDHKRYPYGAYFGEYVKSADVFRCPADPLFLNIAGQQRPRARSYSMNNCFGSRMWTTPSRYTLFMNATQLKHPSNLFVLLEQLCADINDGCAFNDPDNRFWLIAYPGSYHDRSGNFVFADGHTELHLWQDPRTTPPPFGPVAINLMLQNDFDLDWLQQHASELK